MYYLPLTPFILTFGKLEQREQVTFLREQKRLDSVRRSSPSRFTAVELWMRSKHGGSWIGSLNLSYKRQLQVSWWKCPPGFRHTNSQADSLILMKMIDILCTSDCSPCSVLLDVVAEMFKCQEHCILGTLLCLSVRYNQHNMLLCLCSHHCPSKMALVSALFSLSGGVRNWQVLTEIHRGAGPSQGCRRAMHTQRKVSWSIGCTHQVLVYTQVQR